jgi:hypothetical protein
MLIKEYETPEKQKKQLKFMKLVFFAHTKEGRRGCIQEEYVIPTAHMMI